MYVADTKLNITANDTTLIPLYELAEFGFGLVYQTNKIDTSQYFANLTTEYPVIFTTNYQGIGLPSRLFSEW